MLHRRFLWYNMITYILLSANVQAECVKESIRQMENDMPQYDENKERAADSLATASLVLGIISIVSILCCCPFVFSAIGIVLALLSKGGEKVFRPRAKTGLILSIVGLVVSFVLITVSIAFPVVMYKTNPEFRKNFIEQYRNYLEQDEDALRQMYGDDTYEQIENFINEQEDSL